MATIEELTDNNFKQNVIETNGVVVVDFWAQWCGPCRKLTPLMEQIQNEFQDEAKIYKIDADKNMNSAKEYGISSLPTVLIFKDGEVKEIMAGMMQKSAIISNIKKYLS
ncbi:MAG: thioredoxin [Candidatus Gastranaerophilales bacterium]|nr:thioredoxin [Candidatus Gastranaerophilales bacterium]